MLRNATAAWPLERPALCFGQAVLFFESQAYFGALAFFGRDTQLPF